MCLIQASGFQTEWKIVYHRTSRQIHTSMWVYIWPHCRTIYALFPQEIRRERKRFYLCQQCVHFTCLFTPCKTESYNYKGCGFVFVCVSVCLVSRLTRPRSGPSFLDINPHPQPLCHILNYDQIISTVCGGTSFYILVPMAMPCTHTFTDIYIYLYA